MELDTVSAVGLRPIQGIISLFYKTINRNGLFHGKVGNSKACGKTEW